MHVRNLASGLYPAELERNGLIAALRELAVNQTQLFGVRCTFEGGEKPETTLDRATALNLYRIAQEAVANALKHAKATAVVIRVKSMPAQLCLTVTDNGYGIGKLT